MERNRAILDKQEFYLYFCDVTFDKAKYPIFYVPLSVERAVDALNLTFDSQVYINKRALEYIVEQVNETEGRAGNLQTTAERIIYLAQHQQDLPAVLKTILNELCHFFQLDQTLDLTLPSIQIARSQTVRLSNTCTSPYSTNQTKHWSMTTRKSAAAHIGDRQSACRGIQ